MLPGDPRESHSIYYWATSVSINWEILSEELPYVENLVIQVAIKLTGFLPSSYLQKEQPVRSTLRLL